MQPPARLLSLLALTATLAAQSADVPEAVRGFSGQVLGTVAARHDDGSFSLRVSQVTRVWKDNAASNIEWFAGRTLRVGPSWHKGDDGNWHRVERHVRLISQLRDREALRLEIRHAERDRFAILELDAAQRRRAASNTAEQEKSPQRPTIPEAVRGFSGLAAGIVRGRNDDGSLRFEVLRVTRVWKSSKAKKPQALVGMTVRVTPRWVKGKNGRWHPAENHVAFLRLLEVGEDYALELHNAELDHFGILELSNKQREWVKEARLK